jgi:hypothetical protein
MCTRAASTSVLRTIQHDVATKQRSAVEVATAYLQQLKSVEDQVKSYLTVNEEHVLAQVRTRPTSRSKNQYFPHSSAITTPNSGFDNDLLLNRLASNISSPT